MCALGNLQRALRARGVQGASLYLIVFAQRGTRQRTICAADTRISACFGISPKTSPTARGAAAEAQGDLAVGELAVGPRHRVARTRHPDLAGRDRPILAAIGTAGK